MKGNHHRRPTALATLLGLSLASAPAMAEDIEVFFSKPANIVAPNVLFILDSSRSMDATSGGKSRMEVLKESLKAVLLPQQPYNKLNVGIMDFNGKRSGGIDFPVTEINSDAKLVDGNIPAGTKVGTVLNYISESYTTLSGDGFDTPMGDALFFASRYYAGAEVFNSGGSRGERNLPSPTWESSTNRYTGGDREADNPATYSGSIGYTYTPITRERNCSRPSDPAPRYRICSGAPLRCSIIGPVSARPAQYRIRTYSCDSSGLECSWDGPSWKNGSASCGSKPSAPQDGDSWIECRPARPAGSDTYERCKENYIGKKQTWGPAVDYISPITHQCQSNYVVLLTDGEPTQRSTLGPIAALVNPNSTRAADKKYRDCDDLSAFSGKIPANGRCLPELVEYMARYDQAPNLTDNQSVYTYTIGFKLSGNTDAQDFLKLLAEKSKGVPSDKGEGEYFDADSPEQLVAVFKKIISEVTGSSVSFSAPSVNVDPNNRLATSEFLYRPEFTPSDKPAWSGDIIQTKLSYDSNGDPVFTDQTPTLAGSLDSSQRNIYTYMGTEPDLLHRDNAFTTGNGKLTAVELQLSANVDRDKLIQWARGLEEVTDANGNVTTKERRHMGDSLHTTPGLVNYATGPYSQVLYIPTNDGLLHAFDISSGTPKEIFAFIPKELLPNLDTLYRNNNTDKKVYGLDGNLVVWQTETHTYLYFGMRRGGRNYYALDITDPTKPKWMWTIEGGTGDFTELGQTWSSPQLTQVMNGGQKTMALIFGGGYDTDQDTQDSDPTKNVRKDDDQGRAIYVVDATSSTKIWSAGPAGGSHDLALPFSNSIPSDPRIIDLDSNGLADRVYVGDTGGRVWRIDLNQNSLNLSYGVNASPSNIHQSTGYLLADFNDGTAAGNRRFYYAPSVAFDKQKRLMIAIGSGYRAHPTEMTTKDRFYVFEDKNALNLPTGTPTPVAETDLGDITNLLALTSNQPGWFIDLSQNQGEKVLAESIIFNNRVIFTSYQPDFQAGSNTCNLSGNTPRGYMLALEDGRPVADLNKDGKDTFTQADRLMTLGSVQFIPSAPYVTFNSQGAGNGGGGGGGNAPSLSAGVFVNQDNLDNIQLLGTRRFWQN